MKKDITIPQGKFKIGRDIHEGVYLIAALNELSFVTIHGPKDKYEHYTLDEDNNAMMVHVEVEKGDTLTIDGKVIMRHITKFIEGDSCNLLEEIENFERDLKAKGVKKNFASAKVTETDDEYEDDEEIEEDDEDEEDTDERDYAPKKAKVGFWSALGTLLSSSPSSSSSSGSVSSGSSWSSSKKKHSGKCDGDCANCPPHYGYRYGRWYYGHSHSEGCVFGGNKCNGGRD